MRVRTKETALGSDSELDIIFESLTIPQLHDVAYALAKGRVIASGKTKDDLIAALRQGSNPKQLALATHRIEALSPFKHAFLFTFRQETAIEFEDAAKQFQPTVRDYEPFKSTESELRTQVCVIDRANRQIYIKLVHAVPTWDFEETAPNEFTRRQFRQRHPIVVLLRYTTQLATISFPGYTQGPGTPANQRLTYDQLAKDCCTLLADEHNLALEGLGVRPALESLLGQDPPEVRAESRAFRIKRGQRNVRMFIDCQDTQDDVSAVLTEEFHSTTTAVRATLLDATMDETRLFWIRLKVQTKLRFSDFAPQLLFLWRRGGASNTHLEYILSRLAPQFRSASQTASAAATWLSERQAGEIVQPSNLIQRFGLSLNQSQTILTQAVTGKEYAFRFRIRTDKALPGVENTWRTRITDLPIAVADEDGCEINLLEPDNIEVGYVRL